MNKNIVIIVEAIIIIGLLVTNLVFGGFGFKKTGIPKEEVAKKTVEYIKKKFVQNGEVKVKDITEESGVYKLVLEIQGREFDSYATKDGQYLFPQAFNLNPPKPKEFPKTEKPDVKLFVMSFCPFGNQAEEMLMPVVDLLKDKADIQLHYIIYSNYASGYPDYCLDKENKYCSMHGIGELNQDIRELCVWKYQRDKFWDFVKEINEKTNAQNVDQKWEAIAKNLGINVEKIKECQTNEAYNLLDQEIALTSKTYPVQDPEAFGTDKTSISGSPTLVINGIIYTGNRSAEDFKKAICSAFKNPPSECKTDLSANSSQNTGGVCK